MTIIKRDQNELRYNSLWLLPKFNNPDYYKSLIKNAKGLFYGFHRQDLAEQLDLLIYLKIEKTMGTNINMILLTYKNLPTLNSFTRPKNPIYANINIYKYDIESWLDEIETWIFQQAIELEGQIRFQTPARQFV